MAHSETPADTRDRVVDELGGGGPSQGAGRPVFRYSRFVRLMKVALPALALVLAALVVVWPRLKPVVREFSPGYASLAPGDGGIAMVNPRYLGTDNDNRPYHVTAKRAVQSALHRDVVTLETPKADMTLKDGSWVALTATRGVFQRSEKRLTLKGGVDLLHDQGYELRTPEAEIDLGKGEAISRAPVQSQGPFGTLSAEGFIMRNKEHSILFTGKSRLILYPAAHRPGGAKP